MLLMLHSSLILLLFCSICSLSFASDSVLVERQANSNWTIGQLVSTTSGLIVGNAAPNATEVSQYLGIPFAQPPTGQLRFAAPMPFTGNGTTIYATQFGPACPIVQKQSSRPATNATQSSTSSAPAATTSVSLNLTAAGQWTQEANAEIIPQVVTSEDCLSLNIWTKAQVGEPAKAVMVWIYGGAFLEGNTNNPLYNGQYIADNQDVVVVSINYRVNIFGFPGLPAGPAAQNVGLLDQRLALEWVRSNIASFGGDPSRITLFGQSAGAQSVDIYSYAYSSDPIVSGFILESGTTALIPALNGSSSAQIWYNVTSAVGCGGAPSINSTTPTATTDQLSCLRSLPSTVLLNALAGQSFVPTIDNQTVFSTSTYQSLAQSGNYIKTPILLGNNDNEGSVFRIQYLQAGQSFPDSYWGPYNLRRWTCPSAIRANASVYNNVPTWRYRWFGVYPDTNLTTYPNSGAYHGSEIPLIFNTTPPAGPLVGFSGSNPDIPGITTQQGQTINYMQNAWAAFAKDPVDGLTGLGWPRYDPAGSTLIRLGWQNGPGVNTTFPQVYDAQCPSEFPVNAANASATASASASGTAMSSASVATHTNSAQGREVFGMGAILSGILMAAIGWITLQLW